MKPVSNESSSGGQVSRPTSSLVMMLTIWFGLFLF